MANTYFKFYVFVPNRFEATCIPVCVHVSMWELHIMFTYFRFRNPDCDVTAPSTRSITGIGGVGGFQCIVTLPIRRTRD